MPLLITRTQAAPNGLVIINNKNSQRAHRGIRHSLHTTNLASHDRATLGALIFSQTTFRQ